MANFESLFALFIVNTVAVIYVYIKTKNSKLTAALVYFVAGLALIATQYKYAASTIDYSISSDCHVINQFSSLCNTFENKMLALLGFFHFSFQPYFYHLANSAMEMDCYVKDRYVGIGRLCLLGSSLLFLRYFLSSYIGRLDGYDINIFKPKELLRGIHLCVFQDSKMNIVGWSVPLADTSYFVMGTSIHFFLLFGPFCMFLDNRTLVCKGILLLVTGPVLSYLLSHNSYEQASIWSVIATMQIQLLALMQVFQLPYCAKTQAGSICHYFVDCRHCGRNVFYEEEDTPEDDDDDKLHTIAEVDEHSHLE